MMNRLEVVFVGFLAAASAALLAGANAGGDGRGPDGFQPHQLETIGSGGGVPLPSFVNWETPQVHPIDLTPDGQMLLVVNTADARLEVFSLASGTPVHAGSVPVGVDPVAVRARTNTEAWVVNHISDSVSIVDLATMNVVRTLKTLDEPCDVVFAGSPQRAFVTCSQVNTVLVFDPANPAAAPTEVPINGEDPRALAVSPDGATVYAAIFESGNGSTVLGGGAENVMKVDFPPNVVSHPDGPHGGVNPPPNNGNIFEPPLPPGGDPVLLPVSLIVKKNAAGQWLDDTGADWTDLVSGSKAHLSGRTIGWDLPDRDLAIISTSNLNVSYAHALMNACMAVGVNPATGDITVVGTDGTNEVRFEPNVNGTFLRVQMATVDPVDPTDTTIVDLNPHLTYATSTVPQSQRHRALGDPRAVVWNSAGTRGYIAGMGSSNIIVVDPSGARALNDPSAAPDTIPVGEGPTGLVLDEARGLLYVLNRFDASISIVSTTSESITGTVTFFDPTPSAITTGRKHLYDTIKNSGLGHTACGSCHIDARMDRLAWDLGDPSGSPVALDPLLYNLGAGIIGNPSTYDPFHPMKGPMTTQTLQDIIGHEPHHWRGDRLGLEAFNPAFMGLQGDDSDLSETEMQEFEDFLATIHFPPNPFRNFDNSLPTSLPLPGHYNVPRCETTTIPAGDPLPPGNALNGMLMYRSLQNTLDGPFACVSCHTLPTGAGTQYTWQNGSYVLIPPGPDGERRHALVSNDGLTNVSMKIPQLRNLHEKTGFNTLKAENNAGFGYMNDGSVDSIERFVTAAVFAIDDVNDLADMVAFMLCFSGSDLPQGSTTIQKQPPGTFSKNTHAAVGAQATIIDASTAPQADLDRIGDMLDLADAPGARVGVIVKGRQSGLQRGYTYLGNNLFQSDRLLETVSASALLAAAAPGSELTWTVVPQGTQTRMGIDRDEDGCFDRDELDGACGRSLACAADWNHDQAVDSSDISAFLTTWLAAAAAGDPAADFNADGAVTSSDISAYLAAWIAAVQSGC